MISVITNNTFNLDGDDIYGVRFRDASNTQVSSNHFNGSGRRAIYVNGDSQMSNWTITANTGLAGFTSADTEDIRLGSNTTLSVVGAQQGASVLDESSDNTVLPQ